MRWWVWCLVAAQEPTPPPERRRAVRSLTGGESYDSIVKRLSEVVDKLPGLGTHADKNVSRGLQHKPTKDRGTEPEQTASRTITAPGDEREDQDGGTEPEQTASRTITAPDDENREDQVATKSINGVDSSAQERKDDEPEGSELRDDAAEELPSLDQAPMKPFVSTSEMRGAVHAETSHRVPHASVSLHVPRTADEQQKIEGKIEKKLKEKLDEVPLAQFPAEVTALDSALQAVSIRHVNNLPPPAEPPEPVKGFMPGTRLPIHTEPPPQHTCDEGKNLLLQMPLTSYPASLELPLMSVRAVVDRVKPPQLVVTDELTQARALFKPAPSILRTEILSDGPISVSGSTSRFVQLPTGGKLKGAQSDSQSAKSGAAGTDKRLNQGRKLDPAPNKETLLTKGVEKAAGDLAAFGGEAAFMNSLKRLVQHLTVKYWTLGRCPRDYSRDCPVGFTLGDNGYCNPNSSEGGPQ
ncbi:MAG: hypothetical protein KVP17_003554 [Porospora cf. gigantea B]|uniref:uncharacterized protein n=1 Tax=Porospora cf. gigantea B TaxID=2853592 RepID=UPI003571E2CD|nr:MAG: hypothetical protein KVP17_003554 [Porospora cf. gigantea B]